MRAQVQRGFGDDADVSITEVPIPEVGPGETLIEVRACGLNRLDLLQQEAALVRGFSLPHIAGMDIAGVVVEVGHTSTDGAGGSDHGGGGDGARGTAPNVGDEVLVDAVSTCGECAQCLAGNEPYCADVRTIGSTRDGGFAEYVVVPTASVYPLPTGMSFVEAACIPIAYITAWHALVTAGRVRAGETVLVNAANSGVSVAIIQFALAAGATVIGTAGGEAKIRRALELGCSHVADHYADDVSAKVMEWTQGRGVDLVVDHVGPALFEASIASLRVEGRMVFCGTTTGTHVEVDLPAVYHWGRTLIGSGGYRPAEFVEMLDAIAEQELHPIVDSTWAFDDIAAAQDTMANGSFFGKLVVTFGDESD